jgi:hypothetical protein
LGLVKDYKRLEGINPIESQKASELESELSGIKIKSAADAGRVKNR